MSAANVSAAVEAAAAEAVEFCEPCEARGGGKDKDKWTNLSDWLRRHRHAKEAPAN